MGEKEATCQDKSPAVLVRLPQPQPAGDAEKIGAKSYWKCKVDLTSPPLSPSDPLSGMMIIIIDRCILTRKILLHAKSDPCSPTIGQGTLIMAEGGLSKPPSVAGVAASPPTPLYLNGLMLKGRNDVAQLLGVRA